MRKWLIAALLAGLPAAAHAQMRTVTMSRQLEDDDEVRVSVELAGLSEDASRWRLHHEFTRSDGVVSASIRTHGAWVHLKTRKLSVPPPVLARDFATLHHTDDFEVLPTPAART